MVEFDAVLKDTQQLISTRRPASKVSIVGEKKVAGRPARSGPFIIPPIHNVERWFRGSDTWENCGRG